MTLILNGTDNSVSAPAVQGGTAGTTTGEYFPATNQWAVATNGTQAMLVDASQNVGIGTSSPGNRLDVRSSTTGVARLQANGATSTSVFANTILALASNGSGADATLNFTDSTAYNSYIGAASGSLYFATNGTSERMRINSSGYVTMPYQPAFRATGNTGNQTNGADATYNQTSFNTGSCYNTSNYRFTAPVAGRYAFQWTMRNQGAGQVYCLLYVNNSAAAAPALELVTTGSSAHTSASTVLNLSANDYVTVRIGSANCSIDGSDSFSGWLIG
jgi:hypothetical protein